MTQDTDQRASESALTDRDWVRIVRGATARQIEPLQSAHVRGDSFGAQRLATLRHADVANPASDPRLWAMTMPDLPDTKWYQDGPSPAELAVHTSLVLYATHQQAQPRPMHMSAAPEAGEQAGASRRPVSLGRSVRRLAVARGAGGHWDAGTVRRFEALCRAREHTARAVALRRLITLMRGEAIPLDYGQLAGDLFELQRPWRHDAVLLRWGRDLHRSPQNASNEQPTTTSPIHEDNTTSGELA